VERITFGWKFLQEWLLHKIKREKLNAKGYLDHKRFLDNNNREHGKELDQSIQLRRQFDNQFVVLIINLLILGYYKKPIE